MKTAHHPSAVWQRAATTSVIWRATAPARRVWMSAEAAVSRAVAGRDSEGVGGGPGNTEACTVSIVRSSRLVRVTDRTIATTIAAWTDSIAGAKLRREIDRLQGWPLAGRLRVAGGVTAVASATALAMQRLTPRPAPLTWIVPALVLLVGVGLLAVAQERPTR